MAIETDENQHKFYDEEIEEARKNDIMMVYTFPHIFIRFNPNTRYKLKDDSYKNPKFHTKLSELKKQINYYKNLIESNKIFENENLLTEIYLYYDEL